jgi:hypothetical protein
MTVIMLRPLWPRDLLWRPRRISSQGVTARDPWPDAPEMVEVLPQLGKPLDDRAHRRIASSLILA